MERNSNLSYIWHPWAPPARKFSLLRLRLWLRLSSLTSRLSLGSKCQSSKHQLSLHFHRLLVSWASASSCIREKGHSFLRKHQDKWFSKHSTGWIPSCPGQTPGQRATFRATSNSLDSFLSPLGTSVINWLKWRAWVSDQMLLLTWTLTNFISAYLEW